MGFGTRVGRADPGSPPVRVGGERVEFRVAEDREGLVRAFVFKDLFEKFLRAGAQRGEQVSGDRLEEGAGSVGPRTLGRPNSRPRTKRAWMRR